MTQDFSTTTPLTAPIGRAALIPSELKGPIESIEQYGTHPATLNVHRALRCGN